MLPSSSTLPVYQICMAACRPELQGLWDGPAWCGVEALEVGCFRPEGSDHRPHTQVRLLYDFDGLYGIFRVEDRYVLSVHTEPGAPVYRDSCVEAFFQPCPGKGYLNFELNAGGAVLASHIVDPTRTPEGFRSFSLLGKEEYGEIRVFHSLPSLVKPELCEPTLWCLEFFIPFNIFCRCAGAVAPRSGARWRANFFKCGDATSHPHWASWSPLCERNFHLPECFGILRFG